MGAKSGSYPSFYLGTRLPGHREPPRIGLRKFLRACVFCTLPSGGGAHFPGEFFLGRTFPKRTRMW